MSRAIKIGALFAATGLIDPAFGGIPAGAVLPYAGSAAPTGWVLCYGQALNRTTEAVLFATIGTTYGPGDGSTTFNVPDMRGRVAAGKDDMGGSAANRLTTAGSAVDGATLGAVGGAQSHTLTTAQMPTHNHGVTHPGHSHTVNAGSNTGSSPGGGAQITGSTGATVSSATTGISIQNNGSGSAHNNTQPTLVSNYIIKT